MKIDLEEFRVKLESLRLEIEASLAASQDETTPVELDQTRVGRLSRIDAIQQQQMALASSRRRRQELRNIDIALQRISNGEYGYCVECDEPISPKRLSLSPTVLTCIECASEH